MLVRRVLGAVALVLVTGWLPAPAASPAAAGEAALPRHVSVASQPGDAPRELYLVVGRPSPDGETLRAVADDWAAEHRVVLQRREPDGWTKVEARRFSPRGIARWQVPVPQSRITYRAVTRVAGERIVSTRVRFYG
jgi:hypothetical protein